jgi:hypothetical protein
MELAVIHTIKDSAAYLKVVERFDPVNLPDGFELLSTATSADVARAICIWRAPGKAALETALTEMLGSSTVNDVFDVHEGSVIIAGRTSQSATV